MEAQLEAAVSSDLAELVQAVAQLVPLFIGGNRLVAYPVAFGNDGSGTLGRSVDRAGSRGVTGRRGIDDLRLGVVSIGGICRSGAQRRYRLVHGDVWFWFRFVSNAQQ